MEKHALICNKVLDILIGKHLLEIGHFSLYSPESLTRGSKLNLVNTHKILAKFDNFHFSTIRRVLWTWHDYESEGGSFEMIKNKRCLIHLKFYKWWPYSIWATSWNDGQLRVWKANYMNDWKCVAVLRGDGLGEH